MSTRRYNISDSIIFRKTKESFGGLSNMASGYSIYVNDIIISASEHLYQACKFPDYPQIQWDIINEPNPMKAKWISRSNNALVRSDWNMVLFKVMQWAIEVKLSQNSNTFGPLLLATGEKNIVEATPKDKVWGAMKEGDYYVGTNALGRLLMFVRDNYVKTNLIPKCINPLSIPNFYLLGNPIGVVCSEDEFADTLPESKELYLVS
jgi:ribA/ribD-fused uncharacterized protein